MLRQEARSQIPAFPTQHIHKAAVFGGPFHIRNFRIIHPRMPPQQRGLRLGRDGAAGKFPLRFHTGQSLFMEPASSWAMSRSEMMSLETRKPLGVSDHLPSLLWVARA